ncbi:hypothetical protein HPP92_002275 [Vanilla planifolia]|uniref:Uncharacterized protein n=1 Tax=Vanilla planifolia TaxID=51239 RepID=A0A835RT45_VANPL|nr:hypothetical protein HPP92_002275 [Vanilla planifolia]
MARSYRSFRMNAERQEEKVDGSTVDEESANRRSSGSSARRPARDRESRRAERVQGVGEKEGREETRLKREILASEGREGRRRRRRTADSGSGEGSEERSSGEPMPEDQLGRDLYKAAEMRRSPRFERGKFEAWVLRAETVRKAMLLPPWRMPECFRLEAELSNRIQQILLSSIEDLGRKVFFHIVADVMT